MFTQFFGNYLLSKEYVTKEQLFDAMHRLSTSRIKLGTLAINEGLMTASEVDNVIVQQTREDKKFGEIAINSGYLTQAQVVDLLNSQNSDFLLLGQTLVDDGIISYSDLEYVIADYKSQNELIDLDMTTETKEDIKKLFKNFFVMSETSITTLGRMYMELLFNNFIRFVGEDFTPLTSDYCKEFPTEKCSYQEVFGDYSVTSYLSMNEETAIKFASRYASEDFEEYDEYVEASLEDFLNLHNGLFVVNCSNEYSLELTIGAPGEKENTILTFDNQTYQFPILYSFGTVYFILEINKLHHV